MSTETRHRDLDVARAITRLERSIVLRLGEALKADGATIEEWRVLSFLGDGDGHPMTAIAEFAMLPPPTLTKVVDRMGRWNSYCGSVDTEDRRRSWSSSRPVAARPCGSGQLP